MAREITHEADQDTGRMIQIITPERLREILDEDGETYERPEHFAPLDQWEVAEDQGSKLAKICKIADLSYEPDPEWADGYVAEVGSVLLAKNYCDLLEAAGYETSWTTDDRRDYQHAFVFVK